MTVRPRIALIHATMVAVDPIQSAMRDGWPEAESFNLLEDALAVDRAKADALAPDLSERIVDLARYARRIGSDGILFTCSAFGAAIEEAARLLDIPVLKPNEAMFEAAIDRGPRIAMIYTFIPAAAGMEDEFREEAARRDPSATITSIHAPNALDALKAGDADTHNRLVAGKATGLSGFDALVLAHFSTARAAAAVRAVTALPVLTSPDTAVAKMKRLVSGR